MKAILALGLFLASTASFAANCGGGVTCPPRTHCINNTICSPNLNPDSELKGKAVWILPQEQKNISLPSCDPQAGKI